MKKTPPPHNYKAMSCFFQQTQIKKILRIFVLSAFLLCAHLFTACYFVQDSPKDFMELYGNIAYVTNVSIDKENEIKNGVVYISTAESFEITYFVHNPLQKDLKCEFDFEGLDDLGFDLNVQNDVLGDFYYSCDKDKIILAISGDALFKLPQQKIFSVKLKIFYQEKNILQSIHSVKMQYEKPSSAINVVLPGTQYNFELGGFLKYENAIYTFEKNATISFVVKDSDGNAVSCDNYSIKIFDASGRDELLTSSKNEITLTQIILEGPKYRIFLKAEINEKVFDTTCTFMIQ